MRRLSIALIAAFVAVAFTQTASAADLPRKAPDPISPAPIPYGWTGFYAGFDIGAGRMSQQDYTFTDLGGAAFDTCGPCGAFYDPAALSGGSKNGLVGGFHGGYNWQFAPAWLLGVEGDLTWTNLNHSVTGILSSPGFPVVNANGLLFKTDVNWMASLRGRLGWIVNPAWLVYATGGVAWASMNQQANATCPVGVGLCVFTTGLAGAPLQLTNTQTGYVVGGGVEWQMPATALGQWRARAEYLYYGFNNADSGSSNFIGTNGSPNVCVSVPSNCNAHYTFGNINIQTVRFGLSYAFR
jgi:outer membrane immunogenic protein